MSSDLAESALPLEVRPAVGTDLERMLEAWLALTRYHTDFERRYELRAGADSEVRALRGAPSLTAPGGVVQLEGAF